MTAIRRTSAQEARSRSLAGVKIVCAYDSREMFEKNHLEGAISLEELKDMLPRISRNDEIIFYCA